MDSFTFQENVRTVCVTATDFPEGIQDAFDRLNAILPYNDRRNLYGISWPDNGAIIYKAAAEIMDPKEELLPGLDTFTIKNGPYNSFYIVDYKKHAESIRQAFELLLKQHEVDPDGYCLEWYINKNDVKCMVPLGPDYQPFTGLNKE